VVTEPDHPWYKMGMDMDVHWIIRSFRSSVGSRAQESLTGLIMERKQGKNDEGPLVYWCKLVATVGERVAPPVLGKVDVMNGFGAVGGSLDSNIGVVGSLLECVYDLFGRLEAGVQFGGGDQVVQHLVQQEEWCYRCVSGLYLGGRQVSKKGAEALD
jgi:hypothetical protein